jgi:hypothetical protein
MASRGPMARQTKQEGQPEREMVGHKRAVQVPAVTPMDTAVMRNKRNPKGRGKEGKAAAVPHILETTAQRTPRG